MFYFSIIIIHAVAAVVAVGPVLFAPWLGKQLIQKKPGSPYFLLGLRATEKFYNVGGWVLIVSGLALLYLTDWAALKQAWLWLCVALFAIDSSVEKWLREPAYAKLENQGGKDAEWNIAARHLQLGLLAQGILVGGILLLMLVRPTV